VVGEVVDEDAREHDPRTAADPEDGGDQPDAARHALARELVADDPEREREHAAADALDDPAREQDRQRGGERGQEGAGREGDQHPHQDALLARGCRRGGRSAASRPTRSGGTR
jgi:hypothetical protein